MSRVFALFLATVILAALLPNRFVFAEMIFKPLVVPNISIRSYKHSTSAVKLRMAH